MTKVIVFLLYLFVVYFMKLSITLIVQHQMMGWLTKIIENNVARNSHNKIWGTRIVFVWRDWGEPWMMSVRIGGLYCEIKVWTLEIQKLTIWPSNLFFMCCIRMLLYFLGGTNADNLTTSFIVYISFSISMLLCFLASTNADNFGSHHLLFIRILYNTVCSFIFLRIQRLTAWAHNLLFFLLLLLFSIYMLLNFLHFFMLCYGCQEHDCIIFVAWRDIV